MSNQLQPAPPQTAIHADDGRAERGLGHHLVAAPAREVVPGGRREVEINLAADAPVARPIAAATAAVIRFMSFSLRFIKNVLYAGIVPKKSASWQ